MSRGETQFVLLDTRAFTRARTRLGDYMVNIVKASVADVDAVALIIEPIDSIGTQEELLIAQIESNNVPAVLVINKIDTVKKEELLRIIARYAARFKFNAVVPFRRSSDRASPTCSANSRDLPLKALSSFPMEW